VEKGAINGGGVWPEGPGVAMVLNVCETAVGGVMGLAPDAAGEAARAV